MNFSWLWSKKQVRWQILAAWPSSIFGQFQSDGIVHESSCVNLAATPTLSVQICAIENELQKVPIRAIIICWIWLFWIKDINTIQTTNPRKIPHITTRTNRRLIKNSNIDKTIVTTHFSVFMLNLRDILSKMKMLLIYVSQKGRSSF